MIIGGLVASKADVVKQETMRWEQGQALNKPACHLMWFILLRCHSLIVESYDSIVIFAGGNRWNTWKTRSSSSKRIPGLETAAIHVSCLKAQLSVEQF